MIVKARNGNVNIKIYNEHVTQTIVMLHGFTGSVATWDKVATLLPNFKVVAIDLVGHGKTDSPTDVLKYTMEEQILVLEEIFDQLNLNKIILLGYSMGGRVALSYTLTFSHRIQHLILESASPGLKTEEEKKLRRASDEELANKIEQNGVESFVIKWENIPLFESQKKLPKEVQLAVREERLAQTEIGLANSLKGMGTGSQNALWTRLGELSIPVTIITGSLDQKFCNIGIEMQSLLPHSDLITVNNVGHAIHVENPVQFATIVKDAIESKVS
jgi:2-succinyl-6-hydroxy-2,4-cyclohexadiene-1-carboxylate synthase